MQDGLGTVRIETDNSAGVEGAQNLDPFGNLIDLNGIIGTSYGFTGELVDGSGLLDLRARRYNAGMGVFASLDPFEGNIDDPMSLNGYGYVEGNPINLTDPSGNQAVCANNMCYDPQNSCSPIVPMCKISVQQQQALMSRLNPSCPVPPNAQLPSLMSTPVPGAPSLFLTSTPPPNVSNAGLAIPLVLAPETVGGAAGGAVTLPELVFGGVLAFGLYVSVKYPNESSTCYMSFQPGSALWEQNQMSCGYLATVVAYSPAQSQAQVQVAATTAPTPSKVQLKPYNPNGGHHIYSKAAWLQAAGSTVYMMGYNEGAALAISAADLIAQTWVHSNMTSTQQKLFRQLKVDVQNGVKTNSLAEHGEIAKEAMIAGFVPAADAVRFKDEATNQLNNQFNIYAPYRIPWE